MRRNRLTESDLSRIVKRVINEDKEEEMEGRSMSITIKDVFDEVVNALDELGGYDDSMKGEAMRLAEDIMYRMQDDLAYISENYEEQLYEILGENF
jgi:predicted nucleic acid-binding protein